MLSLILISKSAILLIKEWKEGVNNYSTEQKRELQTLTRRES